MKKLDNQFDIFRMYISTFAIRKFLICLVLSLISITVCAQQYVDLGLPSGTLWCSKNEPGYYTYGKAVNSFGNRLPTDKQFNELVKECKWTWNEKGYYKVKGPNGKSIILPAYGYISASFNPEKSVTYKGYQGYYWSRTQDIWDYSIALVFASYNYSVNGGINRKHGYSVRLVK